MTKQNLKKFFFFLPTTNDEINSTIIRTRILFYLMQSLFERSSKGKKTKMAMNLKILTKIIFTFFILFKWTTSKPFLEGKYSLENHSSKRIMSSTVKPIQTTAATTTTTTTTISPVKFVPLFSLLANLFTNFLKKKFGKFSGVNVNENKRRK